MKNTILRKAIRKYINENYEDLGIWGDFDSEEMMGAARREAMQDIESSGENFVDLGKSEFEKDLSIEDMLKDLEDAKHGKTGMDLKRIQKQIDQIKRFGGGSLNEESELSEITAGGGMFMVYADDIEDSMDKNKIYTDKEFIDVFTQRHALPHSKVLNGVKEELKGRGFKFENNINEEEENTHTDRYMFFSNLEQMKKQAEELLALDENEVNEILENGHDWAQDHIATAKESMDQVYDFLMNTETKDKESEIEEGIGTGLEMKNGMNVKESEVDEDSLRFRHTAGQREKARKGVPLGKYAPHSQAALKDEGISISLQNKKGMNVKPTNKN